MQRLMHSTPDSRTLANHGLAAKRVAAEAVHTARSDPHKRLSNRGGRKVWKIRVLPTRSQRQDDISAETRRCASEVGNTERRRCLVVCLSSPDVRREK